MRKLDANETIEVAAGLVFRDSKLLITQRRPEDHLGGLWEFPGGKRESDESFKDCLRRELREELGIEVEPQHLILQVRHEYSEKTVEIQFFRCAWKSREPQALGCQSFKWVERAELSAHTFPAADAKLVAMLIGSLDFWR